MWTEVLRTTRFRLTLLYLAIFAVSTVLLALAIFALTRWTLEREIRQQIEVESTLLVYEYREEGIAELIEEIEERLEKTPRPRQFVYTVHKAGENSIFTALSDPTPTPGWHRRGLQDASASTGSDDFLILATRIDAEHTLVVGKSLEAIAQLSAAIGTFILWALLALLALGGIGGYLLSRRVSQRIGNIVEVSRRMGEGDLSRRIAIAGNADELDDLARVLNAMFDQVARLLHNQRIVTVNIAHDLRTPLARLKNQLHRLDRGLDDPSLRAVLEHARHELDTTLKLFDAMLKLAELDSGKLRSQFGTVDLAELLTQIAEAYTPVAEDSGHGFHLERPRQAVPIAGDRPLLTQMVSNLLDNAIAHAGPRCAIDLRLTKTRDTARIQVRDNGRGIPEALLESVLQPFQKSDSQGFGLGLPLVAAIVRLHRGSLQLHPGRPGLQCDITLPLRG